MMEASQTLPVLDLIGTNKTFSVPLLAFRTRTLSMHLVLGWLTTFGTGRTELRGGWGQYYTQRTVYARLGPTVGIGNAGLEQRDVWAN